MSRCSSSAAVYVWIGGWWFGIGLVLLLFVHEMGHVRRGEAPGPARFCPVFIPFLGAYVTLQAAAARPWREAQLAIAGPLAGLGSARSPLFIAASRYDSER